MPLNSLELNKLGSPEFFNAIESLELNKLLKADSPIRIPVPIILR